MRRSDDLLVKTLVLPFYKRNAGLFAFLLFFLFAAVGTANGVGLIAYHLSLIKGILTSRPFLICTMGLWLLYALKCAQFVRERLASPEYAFLSLLNLKPPHRLFGRLLQIQFFFLLPIMAYAAIAVVVGIVHHWEEHIATIIFFFLLMILAGAGWYQYLLGDRERPLSRIRLFSFLSAGSSYWFILCRYLFTKKPWLFLFIKLFSCAVAYGLISRLPAGDTDLRMVILFYAFGLLGHGILIYAIRDFEERELFFYRGLPVSLRVRLAQYLVFYLLVFIPEMMTIGLLAPLHIGWADAGLLIFFGYSVLLFLNTLLFLRFFRKSDYLKIVTGLYLAFFVGLLTGIFPILALLIFFLSVSLFLGQYNRFEKTLQE